MQTSKHYHLLESLEHRVLLAHEGDTSSEAASFPDAVAMDLIFGGSALYFAIAEGEPLSAIMGVLFIASAGVELATYYITNHPDIVNASPIDSAS